MQLQAASSVRPLPKGQELNSLTLACMLLIDSSISSTCCALSRYKCRSLPQQSYPATLLPPFRPASQTLD